MCSGTSSSLTVSVPREYGEQQIDTCHISQAYLYIARKYQTTRICWKAVRGSIERWNMFNSVKINKPLVYPCRYKRPCNRDLMQCDYGPSLAELLSCTATLPAYNVRLEGRNSKRYYQTYLSCGCQLVCAWAASPTPCCSLLMRYAEHTVHHSHCYENISYLQLPLSLSLFLPLSQSTPSIIVTVMRTSATFSYLSLCLSFYLSLSYLSLRAHRPS